MRARLSRGFTLIELLIGLAILTLLTVLAVPMYTEMIGNSEVRNAAENVLNGLRTAQASAIKLNAPAKFVLSSTGWQVQVTDPDSNDFSTTACATDNSSTLSCMRTYNFTEGAQRAVLSATGEVTFNGLGQIINNVDGNATLTSVTVTSPSGPRTLTVIVGTSAVGTGMKLCDPSYPATDPVGCPAT